MTKVERKKLNLLCSPDWRVDKFKGTSMGGLKILTIGGRDENKIGDTDYVIAILCSESSGS